MSCRAVVDLFQQGAREAAREHVAACADCAALVHHHELLRPLRNDEAAPQNFDAIWARTELELEAERRWTRWARNRSTPLRVSLVAAGCALLLLLVTLASRRPDFHVYPAGRLILSAAVAAAVAGVGIWMVLRPAFLPRWPRATEWALLGAATLFALVPGLLPPAHASMEASLAGAGADLVPRAAGCFAWGSGVAVMSLLLVAVAMRGRRNPSALPPSAWAIAGLMAALGLMVHCPLVPAVHLHLGHASIGVVLGLVALGPALATRYRGHSKSERA